MLLAYIPQDFIDTFSDYLEASELEEFLNICQKPLRKSIRVNTLKISVEDFLEKAKEENWQLTPIPWCQSGFWIDREDHSLPLGKHYLHLAGYFYIQEASSMLPPEVLGVEENDIVLDVAAAPGSKTTQLAALMKNKGLVVANEPETSRIKAMASNLERLGVANVLFSQKDGRAFSHYFPNFFDRILLDAPCSGEGTVRKDHTALEHWNIKKIQTISELQWTLLEEAFKALKPGGEMVYSTCTLSPEENEYVVQKLLDRFPSNAEIIPIDTSFIVNTDSLQKSKEQIQQEVQGMNLKGVIRVWPQVFDSEGFFVAKIKKNAPTEEGDFQMNRRNSPFSNLSKRSQKGVEKLIQEWFEVENIFSFLDLQTFWERGDEVWVRPEVSEKIAQRMILDRGGLLLGTWHKNDFRFTNEGLLFLMQSGMNPVCGMIELNNQELKDFQSGLDISFDEKVGDMKQGQQIVCTYKDVPIGIGKALKGKVKNQLPRYFVTSF